MFTLLLFLTVAGVVYFLLTQRKKLPALTSSGAVMPSNWKLWAGAAGIVLIVSLGSWFWDTLNGSLWWRVVLLALIAFICFRWAKSKDKGLLTNIGNAALIALAVVLLVSAPGRGVGDSFDAKAEAVTKHGVSALIPASFGCPDDSQPAKVGKSYEVVRDCGTLRLTGLLPKGVTFEVTEGSFSDNLEDHLDIKWPYNTVRTFALPDQVPAATKKIVFRIVSPEESAELDRIGAKATIFNVSATAGTK